MKNLNWEDAKKWQEFANIKKEDSEPKWSWDCNFKLDFDGDVITVEGRFYPPHYQPATGGWEGKYRVSFLGEVVFTKEFRANDLDSLKDEVEKFNKHYLGVIKSRLFM